MQWTGKIAGRTAEPLLALLVCMTPHSRVHKRTQAIHWNQQERPVPGRTVRGIMKRRSVFTFTISSSLMSTADELKSKVWEMCHSVASVCERRIPLYYGKWIIRCEEGNPVPQKPIQYLRQEAIKTQLFNSCFFIFFHPPNSASAIIPWNKYEPIIDCDILGCHNVVIVLLWYWLSFPETAAISVDSTFCQTVVSTHVDRRWNESNIAGIQDQVIFGWSLTGRLEVAQHGEASKSTSWTVVASLAVRQPINAFLSCACLQQR